MSSTISLPLLPDSLWPGVVAPDKVQSMDQTEQTVWKQMTDVKLWLLYSNTWNHLSVGKKSLGLFNNIINKMYLQIIYIYIYIYIKMIWHSITNNGWYAIKTI